MARLVTAFVLVVPLACGDDSGGTSTSSIGASSGVATTTSSSTTSSTGGADTTGLAGTDTSAASTDTSTGSTTGGSPISYSAVAIIGGLDRVRIAKADHDADLCTLLSLVSPASMGPLTITTPEGWSVEFASISAGAAACGGQEPPQGVIATAGTGTVGFGELGVAFPCSIDVDVQLEFPADMQVPTDDAMSAVAIAVDGC